MSTILTFFRILFVIVLIFVICSSPRTILNLVELEHMLSWYYSRYFDPEHQAADAACFDPAAWEIILGSFSSFLMILNASLGFLVYCLACSQFKQQFKTVFKNYCNNCRRLTELNIEV